jgi:hypothetical protein
MVSESRTSAMAFLGECDSAGDAETAEQDGEQDECQSGRRQQATNNDDGERALHFRSRAGGEEHRHQAEGGDAGRHQDRPQPAFGSFDDDFGHRHAARQQLIEVGDHHHAIEHGDAEQGDEADRSRH